jgi:hypothetical protein
MVEILIINFSKRRLAGSHLNPYEKEWRKLTHGLSSKLRKKANN